MGQGAVVCYIVGKGKVGEDDAVDADFGAAGTEGLKAEAEDGVEVTHEDERQADVAADVGQVVEEPAERHAVAKGVGGGALDDGAVGHGVTKGDADFDQVDAVALQSADGVGRSVGARCAGAEVNGEQVATTALEEGFYTIHIGVCGVMGMDDLWGNDLSCR